MTVVRVPTKGHRLSQERRRRKPVMLFLNEAELTRIDTAAEAAGMPRATYIRWLLFYANDGNAMRAGGRSHLTARKPRPSRRLTSTGGDMTNGN
jgi:hypothetical protein